MNTAIKTTVSLCVTAVAPVVVFFILGLVLGFSALFVGAVSGKPQFELTDMSFVEGIWNIAWWAIICVAIGAPFAFSHLLFFGIPAFLLGWWFRAIRWWSVLITSFLIGFLPVSIYSVITDFNLPTGFDLLTRMGILLVGVSVVLVAAGIMGLFGISAGLTFWFLWRYWASPQSPAGRPVSVSLDKEGQAA